MGNMHFLSHFVLMPEVIISEKKVPIKNCREQNFSRCKFTFVVIAKMASKGQNRHIFKSYYYLQKFSFFF